MILKRFIERFKKEKRLYHLSKYWILLTAEGWIIIFMSAIIICMVGMIVHVLLFM